MVTRARPLTSTWSGPKIFIWVIGRALWADELVRERPGENAEGGSEVPLPLHRRTTYNESTLSGIGPAGVLGRSWQTDL
jgi:hypothetical protein